jgi:hypothetical protein
VPYTMASLSCSCDHFSVESVMRPSWSE